jgi:hypothetical protein
MTNEEQRELLTNFCDQVRDALLEQSGKWPEHWDGFELRWLVKETFEYEARMPHSGAKKRKKEFLNDLLVNRFY